MWHYFSSQNKVHLFYVLFVYSSYSYVTRNRSVGNYSFIKQFFVSDVTNGVLRCQWLWCQPEGSAVLTFVCCTV